MTPYTPLKVEYQANAKYENPYQNSEKNSMYWSKVNVSNNEKKHLAMLDFFLNAIYFLGIYIKNSNKKPFQSKIYC